MPSTARHHSSANLSARILVVGLWAVLFGMFILVFTLQLFASLASFSSIGVLGQETGTGIDTMLFDTLLIIYRGGALSLGAGSAIMALGGLFVVGVSR